MKISGYVPFYNNASTVREAVGSLRRQEPPLNEVFAVDDGSTDNGAGLLETAGVRVFRQPTNLGRGAARARAMQEARHELVLCCDATNVLPSGFARAAMERFETDAKLAAVFGLIMDPSPKGPVGRWRARHLFKEGAEHRTTHRAPLITFGTMVRASALQSVGGFNPLLRHSEDAELGIRLLAAGFDVVADPKLKVLSNVQNTMTQVLERYWRWYAGKDESFGLRAYAKSIWFSARTMAMHDLRERDPFAAIISLGFPHYQALRFLRGRSNK